MFGIGLPEMILILALALIVVGPDKLPDLARSLAKGILDLKKTAEGLKASFAEEGNPLATIRPELEDAAKSLKNNLLDAPDSDWKHETSPAGVNPEQLAKPTGVNQDIEAEFREVTSPALPHGPQTTETNTSELSAPEPEKLETNRSDTHHIHE